MEGVLPVHIQNQYKKKVNAMDSHYNAGNSSTGNSFKFTYINNTYRFRYFFQNLFRKQYAVSIAMFKKRKLTTLMAKQHN